MNAYKFCGSVSGVLTLLQAPAVSESNCHGAFRIWEVVAASDIHLDGKKLSCLSVKINIYKLTMEALSGIGSLYCKLYCNGKIIVATFKNNTLYIMLSGTRVNKRKKDA